MTKFWSERQTTINPDIEKDILFTLMEKTNSNILITGAGGTGKSTILKEFVKKTRKNCIVLAPTGIAATNIGGQTIHSFFYPITDINKERFRPLYKKIDTIIIDEISMVRRDIFEAMDKILKNNRDKDEPFGGVQLIMFGDMYQLPPVVTNDEKEMLIKKYQNNSCYFFDSYPYTDLDLWVVHLNQIYRQSDAKFIEILNRMQKNILTTEDIDILNKKVYVGSDEEDYVILCTKNSVADDHNQHKLDSISSPMQSYNAIIHEEYHPINIKDISAAKILNLKSGARVIFLINDKDDRFYNGSLGTVVGLSEDFVQVKLDSNKEIIKVQSHDWEIIKNKYESGDIIKETIGKVSQIPLRLAWAMTIHKSQGQTIDKVMIDLRYSPWESGHSYVAFSRVRSLDGLRLKTQLRKEDIKVDPIIIDWENKLKQEKIPQSDQAVEITISGINYDESREIIGTIDRELIDNFGICENSLILWQSQTFVLIRDNPFFFNFVKARMIFLLDELKKREKKTIIINEGKQGEIVLTYKPSIGEYYKDLMKKRKAMEENH